MLSAEKKGFSIIEFLIVFSAIAFISAILIIFIDPFETIKKARDAQRISDLTMLKSALGVYLALNHAPSLDGSTTTPNIFCFGNQTPKIWISIPKSRESIGQLSFIQPFDEEDAVATDGTGWIPIDMSDYTGGSLPIDPINTANTGESSPTHITNDAYMYRYSCSINPLTFVFSTNLESKKYTEIDNRELNDGGNNPRLYEIGTNLKILPTTDNF